MSDRSKAAWVILMAAAALTAVSTIIMRSNGERPDVSLMISSSPSSASASAAISANTSAQISHSTETATIPEPDETEATTKILCIDINTASAEELMLLDGIGEVLAERIIAYRTANSSFRNIEELINVEGIGMATLEKIRAYVYVENPIYETVADPEPDTKAEVTMAESETITEKIAETASEENSSSVLTASVNINTAEKDELMLLPYVDEEIAEAIIQMREKIGGYSDPVELILIEELKQNQVAEIIKFVTVSE